MLRTSLQIRFSDGPGATLNSGFRLSARWFLLSAFSLFLFSVLLSAGVLTGVAAEKAASKEKLPVRPRLPFSGAVRVGDTHYLAGLGSRDPKLGGHPDGFEAQVRQLMVNLQALLKKQNLDFNNVVYTHAYITYPGRFDDFHKIYREYFSGPLPAITTVGIPRLPATEVEIAFIASERPQRTSVKLGGITPGKHYSHAVMDGDFLYASGVNSRDRRTGQPSEGDFSHHVRLCFDHLLTLLKAAGLSSRDVVKVEVFTTDLGQLDKLNEVYQSIFPENAPPRTTVGVNELTDGAPVVINLIAARGKKVVVADSGNKGPQAAAGFKVGDRLFLPVRTGTKSSDVGIQVREVMDELEKTLHKAGLDFSNVVDGKIYLADMSDYAAMNEAYGSYFSTLFPARACIQAASLPGNSKVEITLTADGSPRR